MIQKKYDVAFCPGQTSRGKPDSGNEPLRGLTTEERTALIQKIQEKVDVMEESELQHLYSVLKSLEIIEE